MKYIHSQPYSEVRETQLPQDFVKKIENNWKQSTNANRLFWNTQTLVLDINYFISKGQVKRVWVQAMTSKKHETEMI
jgi:hypothetical protein